MDNSTIYGPGVKLTTAKSDLAVSNSELHLAKACIVCGEGVPIPHPEYIQAVMCDKCKQAIIEMRRKIEC